MTTEPIPIISNPEITTSFRYGGDVMLNIRSLFTDIDLSPLFEGWRPKFKTQLLFRSGTIAMLDEDSSNEVHLYVDDITNVDGAVNLHIPAFTDEDDTIILQNHPQTINYKVLGTSITVADDIDFNNNDILNADISGASNNIINISDTSLLQITDKGKLPDDTLYTDDEQEITEKTINADLNILTNIENEDIKIGAAISDNKLAQITDKAKLPSTTLYTVDSQIVTNKEFDIKKNTVTRFARMGWYNCSGKDIDAGGTLKDLGGVGSLTATLGTPGKYHRWIMPSGTAGEMAGVYYLENYVAVRQHDPLLRIMFLQRANGSSNRRQFAGWTAQRIVTNSNTVPLDSDESGFLFGHGATDTNYQIFHNDGSNTCVKVDTGVAIPASDTYYIVEIAADNATASFKWTLWSVVTSGSGNLGSKNAQLGTGTISSRIPAATIPLYFQDILYNTLTTAIDNPIMRVEVFSL